MTTPNVSTTIPDMQELTTASNFAFSGVSLNELQASEYTLVTIAVDMSGSMSGHERNVEQCCNAIIKACRKSPRKNNLLVRLVTFDDTVHEVHGFREIQKISDTEYNQKFRAGGGTELYFAVKTAIEASVTYGALLNGQDYQVNGVLYVVTDGMDNNMSYTANHVKQAYDAGVKAEVLESIAVILIGVGDSGVSSALAHFQQAAGLTQFIDLSALVQKTSMEGTLAKMAGFVSKSIESTSRSLQGGNSNAQASMASGGSSVSSLVI